MPLAIGRLSGVGRRDQVAQQAAIEQHRVLQAQFDAQFVAVAQRDFGNQHLDHDLRRRFVQLLDQLRDLVEVARRGTDDQPIADRFRHDNHFPLQILERVRLPGLGRLQLSLALQELVDRRGHVDGRTRS